MTHAQILDRFKGCLVGLATGDALGTTLEFEPPGDFIPIRDMVGGGPFYLPAGHWTDDTSMALCLGQSLLDRNGFDPRDQMEKYLRWKDTGYMSSTDKCFDIGRTVAASMQRYLQSGDPYSGATGARSAGNGSIMRLAPVPMHYLAAPRKAMELAGESSRTTHALPVCRDACRYMAGLLVGAMRGESRERLLSPRYSPIPGYWDSHPLHPDIDAVASGSFRAKHPPDIRGTGYVVSSLEAALWAFATTESFRDGALAAVNLGDDADTTGAVYGQIAGAHYGLSAIPETWRAKLAKPDLLEGIADALWRRAVRRQG